MKKTLFAQPCMAAIALAAFVGMRTLERNKNINETLLMANVEALTSEEIEYGESSPCYVGAEQYACVAFATGLIEVVIHIANAEGESKGIDLKSYMGYDQYIAEGKGTLRGINDKRGQQRENFR